LFWPSFDNPEYLPQLHRSYSAVTPHPSYRLFFATPPIISCTILDTLLPCEMEQFPSFVDDVEELELNASSSTPASTRHRTRSNAISQSLSTSAPRPRSTSHSRSHSLTNNTFPQHRPLPPIPPTATMNPSVPRPGPARLSPRSGPKEWLEQAKMNRYLPEYVMKQLCEMVKEHLMEGSYPYSPSVYCYIMLTSLLQNQTSSLSRPQLLSAEISMDNSTI